MNQLNAIVNLKKFFVNRLNEQTTFKKKFLRTNRAPYMAKRLRKAIMRRYELKSKYLKIQTQESFKSYKKPRNISNRLYMKEPKKYYNLIDFKNISKNRRFWKTVKSYLSDKASQCSQINIVNQT